MNQIHFKDPPARRLHLGAIFRDVLVPVGATALALVIAHFGFRAPSAGPQELGEMESISVLVGAIAGFALAGDFSMARPE